MARALSDETLYLAEQRRYRRLEVMLPVWLAAEEDFDKPDGTPWSLGYTRDISMGGSKVYVPPGEEAHWRDICQRGCRCFLRFDLPHAEHHEHHEHHEYVSGRVRHTAREQGQGNLWLGVEYDEGAHHSKAAAMRAGLHTLKTRRRWQSAVVLALIVIGLGGVIISRLNADNKRQQAQITQLKQQAKAERTRLDRLSTAGLVGTRAEGIDNAFQRKQAQTRLRSLTAHMKQLNNPDNRESVERDRIKDLQSMGISASDTPLGGVNARLGIAMPYGYAWTQVTADLEEVLGRRVPLVVIFRDFHSNFPLSDCIAAHKLAKTLQITWEPWYFSDQHAVRLQDIVAGKYDRYIDTWANAARTFGNEVQIRWGHEFNGNWYPWSIAANSQNWRLYRDAYRHVHDRFSRAGAYNVRWVWCMNAENVPNVAWNNPLLTYPGDPYVNIVAIDGYNFGKALPHSSWQSFDEVFGGRYAEVLRKIPNKPLFINEIGCATVGGDKVAWLKDMDRALRTQFTRVTGVVWFEAQKEADWRMVSSPDSAATCRSIWNQNYYRLGES